MIGMIALDRRAGLLDRLDERLRRERLVQVGNASRFDRSQPFRRAVISGYIDDRRLDALVGKSPTQLDAGLIVQIDIDDDADRLAEIVMIEQRPARAEHRCPKAVLAQQPRDARAYRGVVVNDENGQTFWQDRLTS